MRRKAKLYLTTLCIGIGVGIALLGLAITSINVNAEGETLIHKPGTTSTVTNLPEPALLVGGAETAVSNLVPEREGFEFMGWVLDYKLQTSYTVKYLNKATNEPLAAEKTMTGLEVGASIAESAIVIDGYEALDPTEVTIELAESDNEIIFWYVPATVDYSDAITVSKTAAGAELIDRSFTITLESKVNIKADDATGLYVENLTVTDTIEDEFVLNGVTAEILDSEGNVVSTETVSATGPTVTHNFGNVQHSYTARLKLEVTAQPDFIGSNGVYTNVGLSGWTYKHTNPEATAADEYSVTCADKPQVNVRVIPITVNVGNATQRMGLLTTVHMSFKDAAGDPIPNSKYDQTRGTWSRVTVKIVGPDSAGITLGTVTTTVTDGASRFNWRVPMNAPLGDYPIPVEITFTADGGPENSATSYGQGTITVIPREAEIGIIE